LTSYGIVRTRVLALQVKAIVNFNMSIKHTTMSPGFLAIIFALVSAHDLMFSYLYPACISTILEYGLSYKPFLFPLNYY